MQNITIWHNPRCSKSRAGLAYLKDKGIEPNVVKYLDNPPSADELKDILSKLGMSAGELIRTKEAIYKELGIKEVDDEEALIEAMCQNPKLHRATDSHQRQQSSSSTTGREDRGDFVSLLATSPISVLPTHSQL